MLLKMGQGWEGGEQCAKENFASSSLEGPWQIYEMCQN